VVAEIKHTDGHDYCMEYSKYELYLNVCAVWLVWCR